MLFRALPLLFIGIAFLYRYIQERNWFVIDPLRPAQFKHRSEYTIIDEIPTTYYHLGQIKDVLPRVRFPCSRSLFV
jgi:hypothetical protein